MILYHCTPAENLRAIMRYGLDPDAPGRGAGSARVHLSTSPERFATFVGMLYNTSDVAVITVVATGLELEPGDDDESTEFAYPGRISPTRLRLRRIVRATGVLATEASLVVESTPAPGEARPSLRSAT